MQIIHSFSEYVIVRVPECHNLPPHPHPESRFNPVTAFYVTDVKLSDFFCSNYANIENTFYKSNEAVS